MNQPCLPGEGIRGQAGGVLGMITDILLGQVLRTWMGTSGHCRSSPESLAGPEGFQIPICMIFFNR